MIILLHTSKTMRQAAPAVMPRQPQLLGQARVLAEYIQTLTAEQIATTMKVSNALADKTHAMQQAWNDEPERQSIAIDTFIGDIYSGLQPARLDDDDRAYADAHLRILSGLYGILRPLDGISPYRLEMGYRLPDEPFANLYRYWGDSIARTLPQDGPVINLAAIEYSKAVTPFIDVDRIVAPRFLTLDPKTNEPGFVAVHAKIARGAFARWLIQIRVSDVRQFQAFDDIGYAYDAGLSTPTEPVFVCREFRGKGLSIRLA